MVSLPSRKTSLVLPFVAASLVLLSCGFGIAGQHSPHLKSASHHRSMIRARYRSARKTTSNATQPQGGQRRALLVGIGDYDRGTNSEDGFGKLNTGPDIANMSLVLKTYYSFPEANIRVLQNENATQENIKSEFKLQLIDKAKPGDQVVFYYTGHGHFVMDTSGDETADHLDEVLVTWVPKAKQALPADKRHAIMYMLDDTFETLLQQLSQKMKGPDGKVAGSITVIFDSCHSGSATKGLLVAKGRPWDERIDGPLPAITQTNEVASGWLSEKDNGVVFLAASQSGQLSYMMPDSANKGSILTYNLAEFLTKSASEKARNITYKQMFDKISPIISGMRASQDPQIEGPINTLLFGDGQPVKTESLPVVRRVLNGVAQVELSQGFLHGITKGSRFDLYRSGKDIKEAANKLAEIEISEVQSIKSVGTVIKTSTPTPQPSDYIGAQAVATEIRYEGQPLKVLIQSDLEPDKAKALSDAVKDLAFITRTDVSAASFDVQLGWCKDTRDIWCKDNKDAYFFRRANGGAASLGSTVEAEPLQKRLLADWRWRRLVDLTLPGPATVSIDMRMEDGSPVRRSAGNNIVLKPGDTVDIFCTNDTDSPLFITLIYLQNSGDIAVAPGEKVTNAQQALNADHKPHPCFSLTEVTAPNGKEVEYLKIFATPRPADFTGLRFEAKDREGRSKGPKNPMEELLLSIKDANAKGAVIKTKEVDTWYTYQIVYEIDPN